MSNIKMGVLKTSENLAGTNSMYDGYEEKLKKADIFVKGLKKKEEENSRKIKLAFWFLVAVVIFVIFRRLLFPEFYRRLFGMIKFY
jgi:hypothetical protein